LASFISFFIPFARLVGIGIFLPLLAIYLFDVKKVNRYSEVKDILSLLKSKASLLFFVPLLGFMGTLIFMFVATGNMFAQFAALNDYVSHHSVVQGLNVIYQMQQFFQFPLALHGFTNSILDRVFFILFLFSLPLIYRYTSPGFLIYSLFFGIVPILSGSYMSYIRYVMVVFPLFIALAEVFKKKKYTFLEMPTLFLFIMMQTLFLIMQSLNYWVA
jgi:hypothetical protein